MADFKRVILRQKMYFSNRSDERKMIISRVLTTRFAPSPSGELHLGHLLAAGIARRLADKHDGKCILRMEDIDSSRCRMEYAEGILQDLEWLGLHFDGSPVFQSSRFPLYRNSLNRLVDMGVLYPCFCTRKQIAIELERSMNAPQGERIDPYPGTCRHLGEDERQYKISEGIPYSWRLDCDRAADLTGALEWEDMRRGIQIFHPEIVGDVILSRKDCIASYHLCVVTDDAEQGITHVTRGDDLFDSTHVHRLLQELLVLPVPTWLHHTLVRDVDGERLSKRNKSLSLAEMKRNGFSPSDVWSKITHHLDSFCL